MERFGEVIRRARQAQSWTLERLATKARTNKGYVSGIETGTCRPPSARLVSRLARALQLNDHELLMRAYVEKAPTSIHAELHRRVFPGE